MNYSKGIYCPGYAEILLWISGVLPDWEETKNLVVLYNNTVELATENTISYYQSSLNIILISLVSKDVEFCLDSDQKKSSIIYFLGKKLQLFK